MTLNANIISEMEGIIDDPFFSETIVHSYPTDETENLTVIWDEPGSEGVNGNYESSFPSFFIKTSDAGNLDLDNSRITRDTIIYRLQKIFTEQSGLTKVEVSEVDE